jgi:hypothetical protein
LPVINNSHSKMHNVSHLAMRSPLITPIIIAFAFIHAVSDYAITFCFFEFYYDAQAAIYWR